VTADGIKGERGNSHSYWYAVADVIPCGAAIGADKNACIRSCEDMLSIRRIDGYIVIDQALDWLWDLLRPGCSQIRGLIHA